MHTPTLSVETLAKRLRDLAYEKNPEQEPLIVSTGSYNDLMITREMVFNIISAPYGSGKTFGIGLRAYHDARLNRYPLANTYLILLRVRDMFNNSDIMKNYITKETEYRLHCGGLIVTALYAAAKDDGCYDNNYKYCFTNIPYYKGKGASPRERLRKLIENTELGSKIIKCPMKDTLNLFLRRVKDILGGRDLLIIYDEFEEIGQRIPGDRDLTNLLLSNAAAHRWLYDQGHRVKTIVLMQSKIIERYWDKLINEISAEAPQQPVECRCANRTWTYSRSAISGTTLATKMEYYNETVYLLYMAELFERYAETVSDGDREIALRLARELRESVFNFDNKIISKLQILRSIAPRIAFDYTDGIAERLFEKYKESSGDIRYAFDEALNDVAMRWRTGRGYRRYYALLLSSKSHPFDKRGNVSDNEIYNMIKLLIHDLIGAPQRCKTQVGSYHSNYFVAESCYDGTKNKIKSGILIFRKTKGPISASQSSRRRRRRESFEKIISERAQKLYESTLTATLSDVAPFHSTQPTNIEVESYLFIILRSGVSSDVILTMTNNVGWTIIDNISRVVKGAVESVWGTSSRRRRNIKGVQPNPHGPYVISDMTDEELLIILMKANLPEDTSPEAEFVKERYQDIVSKIKARVSD